VFRKIGKLIADLPISSGVFLYIFLPLLLFATALNIEVGRVIEDAAPILLLAIVAVLVATLVIGGALDVVASVPSVACFMLRSIVATTDPVAVVGIFRDLGASARLSRLVEGESLLNDAAAITLFVLLLDILTGGHPPNIGHAPLTFVRSFVGGIATGYAGARLILGLMRWLLDLRLAQVTLTLALPYLVYIVGEHQLHVSSVVATATAGLVMSAVGQPRMSPDDWHFLHAPNRARFMFAYPPRYSQIIRLLQVKDQEVSRAQKVCVPRVDWIRPAMSESAQSIVAGHLG
jgi:Na+:H+ antiporter